MLYSDKYVCDNCPYQKTDEAKAESVLSDLFTALYPHLGEISLGMDIKIVISKWRVTVAVHWKGIDIQKPIKDGDIFTPFVEAISELREAVRR